MHPYETISTGGCVTIHYTAVLSAMAIHFQIEELNGNTMEPFGRVVAHFVLMFELVCITTY